MNTTHANGSRRRPSATPPHDVDQEKAVIGAMLLGHDRAVALLELVDPADFYVPAHARIAGAIRSVLDDGAVPEPQAVAAYLAAIGAPLPNPADLVTLQLDGAPMVNAKRAAKRLVGLRRCRDQIEPAKQLLTALQAGDEQKAAEQASRLAQWTETASSGRRVRLATVSDVERETIEWLWKPWMPLGKVGLLDGDPGLGKSTLTLEIAARVTTGAPMPDGTPGIEPAAVLIASAEDGVGDTIRPRLEAAGADLTRVHTLEAVTDRDDEGAPIERDFSLPADIDRLADAVRATGARLVVIDPLMAFLHPTLNAHRDQDVRGAFRPLAKMAEQTGACLLVVRHLNKSPGGPALYRGGGSIGIIGAARFGLLLAADPEDERRRVLAMTKSNLAQPATALSLELVAVEEYDTARIRWLGESTHTAAALLSLPVGDDERSAQDDAVEFLRDYLGTGSQLATDVKKDARSAGIAERTLDRARKRANVTTKREGFGKGSKCWWSIDLEGVAHVRHIDDIDATPEVTADMADMASMEAAAGTDSPFDSSGIEDAL